MSIIRKNLGLCKCSEIYLRTFKGIHGSNGMKYRFHKERYVKKLMIFKSIRKKAEFCHSAVKDHVWKESGVTTQGRREVEVAILLLNNDKNNVTAENELS